MREKVFITQDTGHNIESARQYGELKVLLSFKDVASGTKSMIDLLYKRLKDVSPEDYILCVGDPIAIGLAVHIAMKYTQGKINFLKWDRVRMVYTVTKTV